MKTHEGEYYKALKEIAYGESNGMPNGGIMCRAIARSALVSEEQRCSGCLGASVHHTCGK